MKFENWNFGFRILDFWILDFRNYPNPWPPPSWWSSEEWPPRRGGPFTGRPCPPCDGALRSHHHKGGLRHAPINLMRIAAGRPTLGHRWFLLRNFHSKTISSCARSTTVDKKREAQISTEAPGPEETNENRMKCALFQRSTVDAKEKESLILLDLFICVDRRPLKKCTFDPIFVSLFGARCLCRNLMKFVLRALCRPLSTVRRKRSSWNENSLREIKGGTHNARRRPAARRNPHLVVWGGRKRGFP